MKWKVQDLEVSQRKLGVWLQKKIARVNNYTRQMLHTTENVESQ